MAEYPAITNAAADRVATTLEERIEAVEPGQWVIIADPGSRFYAHYWNGTLRPSNKSVEVILEIDGYAAGPVAKLTPQFVFTEYDVRFSKRHSRDKIRAVVPGEDEARDMLARIKERQDKSVVEESSHKAALAAIYRRKRHDIRQILGLPGDPDFTHGDGTEGSAATVLLEKVNDRED